MKVSLGCAKQIRRVPNEPTDQLTPHKPFTCNKLSTFCCVYVKCECSRTKNVSAFLRNGLLKIAAEEENIKHAKYRLHNWRGQYYGDTQVLFPTSQNTDLENYTARNKALFHQFKTPVFGYSWHYILNFYLSTSYYACYKHYYHMRALNFL